MATINIKIVSIEGDSVIVKYASENSAKSIDEYDPIAYQPKTMGYSTLNEFIDGIRPMLMSSVMIRDNLEKASTENLDLSSWVGHESTHSITMPHELNINEAMKKPEVKI